MLKNTVVVLASIVAFTFILLAISKTDLLSTRNMSSVNKLPQQNGDQQGLQSIPLDHPNLVQTSVVYVLNGTIDQIKNEAGGELVLKSKASILPKFKISKDTQVVRATTQTASKPSNLSALGSGTEVTILVTYDIKTETWTLNHVTILDDIKKIEQPATQSSSPR